MDREALPIEESMLAPFRERSERLLQSVSWRRRQTGPAKPATDRTLVVAPSVVPEADDKVAIIEAMRSLTGALVLHSEEVHHVLTTVARGIEVGLALSGLYMKASQLEALMQANRRTNGLTEAQRAEFAEKRATASAVLLFGMAAYIAWELEGYETDRHERLAIQVEPPPELTLENTTDALNCCLYHYGVALRDGGVVREPIDVVKVTLEHFRGVLRELMLRIEGLRYVEPFTSRTYTLGEFVVNGFTSNPRGAAVSVEFNRLPLERIVGNRRAKHAVSRIAKALVCYHPTRKRNVMFELGALCRTFMGFGKPGTGKSMLIAALATLIHDYCNALELSFVFHPLPADLISTFQGGSGERMTRWLRVLHDPRHIVFGAIDDAEGHLRGRTHHNTSSGSQEVVQAFLTGTESATAVWHGQAVLGLFTNLPEIIDPAVMSRLTDRTPIEGPETKNDFVDQLFLWLGDVRRIDEALVDLVEPGDYEHMTDQRSVANLGELAEPVTVPKDERLRAIYDGVCRDYEPTEEAFFATLFHRVVQAVPEFSGRDVRNVFEATHRRLTDIDLPDEWVTVPTVFHRQSPEVQLGMVQELIRANLKGIRFHEVLLQEAIRYLDIKMQMADLGFKREVATRVKEGRITLATRAELARLEQQGLLGV